MDLDLDKEIFVEGLGWYSFNQLVDLVLLYEDRLHKYEVVIEKLM